MSRSPTASAYPASRPNVVDYFFLFVGCSLSLYLMFLDPVHVKPKDTVGDNAFLRQVITLLPLPMRLTEGVVLMWPFFLVTQWLTGRSQGLTSAEWLWVVAWIGIAVLTGLAAWDRYAGQTIPEFLRPLLTANRPRHLWYLVVVPSMGVLALLFLLLGALSRGQTPWTHPFSVMLMIWPALPLAAILAFGEFTAQPSLPT
jgi:hypothetical protein